MAKMTQTQQMFESISPADDSWVGSFPVMTEQDVAEVVDRGRIAAHWWSEQSWRERRRRLMDFKAILATRSVELAELVHAENGKPVADATLEILLSIEHIDWAARHARRVLKERRVLPGLLTTNQDARVEYRPYGVIGVIGPWNYPVFTPVGSIAYALAAGNAAVFKPSEFTTGIGQWLVAALGEVIPEQPVCQIVTGFGATGAALCNSGVDKVSFTGSTATGKKVMAACAESLTPVLLECGGKDAAIVDQTANLKKAAEVIAFGAYSNAGQTCVGAERVYVHESVYPEFIDLLAGKVRRLQAGAGDDADYGPMTMPAQIDVVSAHLEDVLAQGGRVVVGSRASVGDRIVAPLLFAEVPETAEAVREETFGPALIVNPVRDMEQAIALTNANQYGLAASVFAGSAGTCQAIARRLDVGMVSMNSWVMYAGVAGLPWGGVGQSGFGRIHGAEGLRQMARTRSSVRERFTIPLKLVSFERHEVTSPAIRRIYQTLHGSRKWRR